LEGRIEGRMTQNNKTALVTGASRGIGRATAAALARAGTHVLVHVPSGVTRRLDAVNVSSILNSNQFQIVRRNDFAFRILHFQSRGFSGAFIQNLKTFLSAGE